MVLGPAQKLTWHFAHLPSPYNITGRAKTSEIWRRFSNPLQWPSFRKKRSKHV